MKKEYVKPKILASDSKKFEKVYSGGCSHFPDNLTGCGYGIDWVAGEHHGVTSDHHTLAPSYTPGDPTTSN